MKAIAKEVLWEAIKLAVVATVTFKLAPYVQAWFPNVPEIATYLGTAFVTGLILLGAYALIFTKATVEVEWVRGGDTAPLTELDVLISTGNGYGSESFVLRVSPGRATGLGWVALQIGCRTGLRMRVEGLHAPVLMVVENVDFDEKNGELARSVSGCAVQVRLTAPVPPDEHWLTARIRFSGAKDDRGTRLSSFQHSMGGSNPLSWLCAKLIRAETKAARIRTRWS